MDATDELARKLIEAFESLGEEIVLEQLAVPEDLADPAGSVEMWVTGALPCEADEPFVVRGKVSVPTAVVLGREIEEFCRLFREELLRSEPFRRATTTAGVASRAVERDGMPSCTEAERN